MSRRGAAPPHWISRNESTRHPNAYVYVDSEAHRRRHGPTETQTWRLGVAACDRRESSTSAWREREWGTFTSPDQLWAWVSKRAPHNGRTVLVCHNLAYDLRVTRALQLLPELGWKLERLRLDTGQAQCVWRNGRKSLVGVDTTSWLPMTLHRVGGLLRMTKPPLPSDDDSDEAWLARCTADVEILAVAWRRIVDWLQRRELGAWRPSGAGTGWGVYRHSHYTHPVLVHNVDGVKQAERDAAATGRCEAWRHGDLGRGRWAEWDYSHAYASIALAENVPVRLRRFGPCRQLAQLERWGERGTALAVVDVDTDVPVLPAQVDGRWCWPTGTFTTTAWWPELRLAMENGAQLRPRWLAGYETAPALRQWAAWVIELTEGRGDGADPIVAAVAKQWGRSVIGRFGMRYVEWEQAGELPDMAVKAGMFRDDDTGRDGRFLQVGNQLLVEAGLIDGDDAAPQVMSYVMSVGRVRLWRAMLAAGFGNVVHVDTDGLVVTAAGSERLEAAQLAGLRRKRWWSSLRVLGPRQLVLDGQPRIQGLPRGAVPDGDGAWRADVWERLPGAMRAGRSDQVRVVTRTIRVRGKDARRRWLPDGGTAAVELTSGGLPAVAVPASH